MTRKSEVQGQGVGTPRKEAGFAAMFSASLHISKGRKIIRYPYWHLDLNAGSGRNEEARCDGSPLVFLREALAAQRRFHALFCDHSELAVTLLRQRLKDEVVIPTGSSAEVYFSDNATFLDHVAWLIQRQENPKYAVGTVLCDPNGFPAGFPLEALQRFSQRFPRIDLMLSLNVSLFARVEGCKARGQQAFMDRPSLCEIPPLFPRAHWMIRNPTPGGVGERFVLLVGRNFDTGAKRFMEFFPLTSSQGQHIITTLKRWDDGQMTLCAG